MRPWTWSFFPNTVQLNCAVLLLSITESFLKWSNCFLCVTSSRDQKNVPAPYLFINGFDSMTNRNMLVIMYYWCINEVNHLNSILCRTLNCFHLCFLNGHWSFLQFKDFFFCLWLIIKLQDLSLGVCYFLRHQNSPSIGPACSLFCHARCCDAGSVWNAGSCWIPRPTRSQGGKTLMETVFACIALMLPDGLMTPCCVCNTVSGGWWN